MALHGEIKVNQHIIGYWEAVNDAVEPRKGESRYSCHVTIAEQEMEPLSLHFKLWHAYADGALVLAQKVLAQAIKERESR